MNDPNYPGGLDENSQGQPGIPPSYGGADWGDPEGKVGRGNKGMLIVFLLMIAVGAVVGVLWYLDKSEQDKWENKLKTALTLPDGEFESALRDIVKNSDVKEVLAQAAFELGEAKDAASAPILAQAVLKGGVVGREAAKALAKIGPEAGRVGIDNIYSQMVQSEELAKAEYAWSLCMLGDERCFAPLLEAVGKRIVTPKSLPEFDPDIIIRMGTTENIIEMAASEDAMLRMYAAMELGFRRDKDTVPALLQLAKDPKDEVAEAAAISLGRTADDRAGPALLAMMEAKPGLKDAILQAVTQSVGAPGLEVIYKSLKSDETKYKVIGKLKALRDPRSKDMLLSVIEEYTPKLAEPATPAAEKTDEQRMAENIRNQALWILEDLGDPRIAETMYEKTQWEPKTKEEIPDDAVRYRQDDMSRKIANGVVEWFGKVRPDGAGDYLMKIYEQNQPYENTPESAQRVKVDIDPLMDAMGRTGENRFCSIINQFLDRDEGFYFQAASHAMARLGCPNASKEFINRMKMTQAERKEGKFASLLESRDWQMEDRLQERRNSIIAVRFLGDSRAAAPLMEIVLDEKDDKELREEAAKSLIYVADAGVMETIVEKVNDNSIDPFARGALIQGLWYNPSEGAQAAMLGILQGSGGIELVKPAAIALGEAANPANDEKLNALLGSEDDHRARAAALAVMLGGNQDALDRVIEILKGQEARLVLREWYSEHPVFITGEMFQSSRLYRRLANARALYTKTEDSEEEVLWPWRHLVDRLKSGWDEGPGGLTPMEIREELARAVREKPEYQELAARTLASLGERGYLLMLQAEEGPHATIARDTLLSLNVKSN